MDACLRHADSARPSNLPADAALRPVRGTRSLSLFRRAGRTSRQEGGAGHVPGGARISQDGGSATIAMTRQQFESLVREAMRAIPRSFRDRMSNVEIVIEDQPTPEVLAEMEIEPGDDLFGLYQGTPLTERGWAHGNGLPDRIVLFQHPLEEASEDLDELFTEICLTLIHEAGHYFGLSEDEVQEAEDLWLRGDDDGPGETRK
jgi:predicted Zn-dependent protease with MMP-like domain